MTLHQGFKITATDIVLSLGYSIDGIGDFNGNAFDNIAMTLPFYQRVEGNGLVIVL